MPSLGYRARSATRLFLGALLAAAPQGFTAQSEVVALRQITLPFVANASQIVDERSGASFTVDQGIRLNIRDSGTARAFVERGLQIRAFRLSPGQAMPLIAGEIEDCYIFISGVFGHTMTLDREIVLTLDENWLDAERDKPIMMAHYVLVFESTGDSAEVFRIKKAHSTNYFNAGIHVFVTPHRDFSKEEVERLAKRRMAGSAAIPAAARSIAPDVTCYLYQASAPPESEDREPSLVAGHFEHCAPANT